MKVSYQTLPVPNDPTPSVIVQPKQNPTKWCVLWLQGWTSTIAGHLDGIKRMAAAGGVDFAMIDPAGFGEHPTSLDSSTKAMQITEARFFYDFLAQKYEKILVSGGSFGAYMAVHLADKNPAAIMLRAPAIFDDRQEDVPFGKIQGDKDYDKRYEETNDKIFAQTLNLLGNYRGMVYVVRHESDELIPRWIPDLYFRTALRSNYLLVPGCAHTPKYMPEPQKYYNYVEQMVVDVVRLEMTAEEKKL